MKQFFQILASFLIAICILSVISIVMIEYQILHPSEQERLKQNKTYWKWNYSPDQNFDIHYVEKGTGHEHIVLIHGFRANTFTWRYLIDPLVETGYHVWSLDLLGYGFSDKPNLEYSVDVFIKQIKDFLAAHNIDKAHLIGSSMGGGLSLHMAIDEPEKIHSLILLDALGYPLDLPLSISIGKHLRLIWGPFLGPTMIRKGLEQLVYDSGTVTNEQVEAYSLPYAFPGGANAALSTLQNFDNRRLEVLGEHYSQIKCPILIIWGDHDTLIPLEHYERFCDDFPHAQKRLIHKCGHIPHEEKPIEVINNILFFLGSI